jgi:hypothetical protein
MRSLEADGRKKAAKAENFEESTCLKFWQQFPTNFCDNAHKIGTAVGGIGFKLGVIALSRLTSRSNK